MVMAEKSVKVPLPDGKLVDGVDVPVTESTERSTDVKLEDGTTIRIKPSVLGAVRITGQYDPEGNPMYVLKATNTMMVYEAPAHLKKGYKPEKAN
jgi:hypothetical protein